MRRVGVRVMRVCLSVTYCYSLFRQFGKAWALGVVLTDGEQSARDACVRACT